MEMFRLNIEPKKALNPNPSVSFWAFRHAWGVLIQTVSGYIFYSRFLADHTACHVTQKEDVVCKMMS